MWPLGSLPLEEGLRVRATPIGRRLPLDVEFAIEGPSGRLTWRAVGLEESARTQDRLLALLARHGAELAPGRPGRFRGGRLNVRHDDGRLEITWPDRGRWAPWAASLPALGLALDAALADARPVAFGSHFAPVAAALGAGLLALWARRAAPARSTLVLTRLGWRYERRGLFGRVAREGRGPLRAGPGRAGPGPRRDRPVGRGGGVTLDPAQRAAAFEVGRALTVDERRWLIELVERFRHVARAH
jgi:hypothetical protein